MANDFDEASGFDKETVIQRGRDDFRTYREILGGKSKGALHAFQQGYYSGAKWQHSLMQERLAAAEREVERLKQSPFVPGRKAFVESDEQGNVREYSELEGYKGTVEILSRHINEYKAENAQLSATCERMRLALKECHEQLHECAGMISDNDLGHKKITDAMRMARQALESGAGGNPGIKPPNPEAEELWQRLIEKERTCERMRAALEPLVAYSSAMQDDFEKHNWLLKGEFVGMRPEELLHLAVKRTQEALESGERKE
jgi:hypothetical protein